MKTEMRMEAQIHAIGLEEEGGITDISKRNAARLVEKYGVPDVVKLYTDPDEGHTVEARWNWRVSGGDGSVVHRFTGFSWGYGGTGPHGLLWFLMEIGSRDITIRKIASWPQEDFRTVFLRGVDFNRGGLDR